MDGVVYVWIICVHTRTYVPYVGLRIGHRFLNHAHYYCQSLVEQCNIIVSLNTQTQYAHARTFTQTSVRQPVFIHSFIHSGHIYSAPSSPLLLSRRSAQATVGKGLAQGLL